MAFLNDSKQSNNCQLASSFSGEKRKERSRSNSLLSSLTKFTLQFRRKSHSDSSFASKSDPEENGFLKQSFVREHSKRNTEEQLRKTLFRRSMEAKFEHDHKSSATLQRCFSEMPTHFENKRIMSSSDILSALNECPKKVDLNLSPKPGRPPKIFMRSYSFVDDAATGTSKEIGYGSLSRKSPLLRPVLNNDDDVFTKDHSSRLSNGDFPSEDGLYVEALWDHVTMEQDELGFKVGNVIQVVDMKNADWWWGELNSAQGWFPSTFVRILVNQRQEDTGNDDATSEEKDDHEYTRVTNFDDDSAAKSDDVNKNKDKNQNLIEDLKQPAVQPEIVVSAAPVSGRRPSMTRDQMRKNVVNEIINSERVFLGHLKDVIEGYLTRCRKRPDMFTDKEVTIIFGNIEEIYYFQKQFFSELEMANNRSAVHLTQIGKIFLKHKSNFTIYSEYCNNHPQSLTILSKLLSDKKYVHFFEACRLLQKMIGISLDGFLLTPVQKICKYPLQLAELLKYTHPDHLDYKDVKSALDAMRRVARMINEKKRMVENVKKISQWQAAVLNWQGENVLKSSKELVHWGEIYFVSPVKHKLKQRFAFLFDHQLIICKKDILRKDLLYYKRRYNLDLHKINPIESHSPKSSAHIPSDNSSNGESLWEGWEVISDIGDHNTVMLCKTKEDYKKWMKAFPLEREIAMAKPDEVSSSRDEILHNVLQTTLIIPGKPKDSLLSRSGSYRSRAKFFSHHGTPVMKHKQFNPDVVEKNHGGSLFRSSSIRRSPFRRNHENMFVF